MLKKLTIKNFALISDLELEFGEQLNILSGETGAGKSIIVDCLMLLSGGRYDKNMLRFGTTSGFIEGVFYVGAEQGPVFADYLDDGDDVLIVTRRFNAEGRNEIKINGRTVNLSMLKVLAVGLVDICGQNEHQTLADIANHIKVIDYYVRHNCAEIKRRISENYAHYLKIKQELEDIGDAKTRAINLDIYKYQLDEIEAASVKENEEKELLDTRRLYLSAEKICSTLSETGMLLRENENEPTAVELLRTAISRLSALCSYGERYGEWVDRLKSASLEIEDVAESVIDELDGLDFSQVQMDKLEKRLDVLRNIRKKYGDFETMTAYKAELIKKLDDIENSEENYEKLIEEESAIIERLYEDSVTLSEIRRSGARELSEAVVKELSELGMADSVFEVRFSELPTREECERCISSNGLDTVEFYLSPNVGQPLKPLVKIISGGELSRLMLALKVVSSAVDDTPTVVFDEIDTGISGRVGLEIAKKLARLAKTKQLLCVTHLPQIAAMADSHYFIDKYTDGEQTFTLVTALDEDGSVDEVSRLSGGRDISGAALKNALQMKQWSDEYKKSL